MPEELESFRLGLRIEYTRLMDWAAVAGLSEAKNHEKFDRKYKANRHLIMAVLSEADAILQYLQKNHQELNLVESDEFRCTDIPEDEKLDSSGNSRLGPELQVHINNPEEGQKTQQLKLKPIIKEEIRDIDIGAYEIFRSPNISKGKQKHTGSIRHVLSFTKKGSQPRNLKWAAMDRQKYLDALKKLNKLTEYLHQTTGDYQLELLTQSSRETCLTMLHIAQSVKEMKYLLESARIIRIPDPESSSDSTSTFSHVSTLVDPAESLQNALVGQASLFERLTQFSIAYAEIHSTESYLGTRLDLAKDFSIELKKEMDEGSRTLAKYRGVDVWVEWKEFTLSPIPSGNGPPAWGVPPQLLKRLDKLSALLERHDKPQEFRVPHCLGFFDDKNQKSGKDRIGFVFGIPQFSPMSLFEILTKAETQPAIAIGDRIRIAKDLTQSLFCIHAVNWLHKGLRSSSIIFFCREEAIANDDGFGRPVISGFEYARLNTTSTSTHPPGDLRWAVYCHPDYQGNAPGPYQKMFDIYSLGIILLEIALWKTADEIFGITRSVNQEEKRANELVQTMNIAPIQAENQVKAIKSKLPKLIRDRLLHDDTTLLRKVRETMGERYHNTVRACICGLDIPDSRQVNAPEIVYDTIIQQAYLRQVIDELQGIRV
ncbi:hypothetical protein BP6252_09607 [Coleophoma cylindrospora]|uniref:Prion-inhibition and propagation HeLo domain-containing protein n=1 Tax=Coleophoma cylindrospora TaxID=1849047 RepID=A0A3D8QW12_9HELO|nr:hypothetical protein BP6252_09607 [Coleophoma cylindrospora]